MLPPIKMLTFFSKIKKLVFRLKSIEQVKISIEMQFKPIAGSNCEK